MIFLISVRPKTLSFLDRRQKMEEEREDKQTGRFSVCPKSLFFLLLSFIFSLKPPFRTDTN
jgi:hypothetical protein